MEMPNWFDNEFDGALKQATAEQALAAIAKQPKIVQAVKDALAGFDVNSKKPGWAGPSRTQTVRKALADVLNAR